MLHSYRARLLAAFLSVVLASLVLFLGLTLGQLIRINRQARTEELQLRLKLISAWIDPALPAGQEALHQLSAETGVAVVVVYADERPRFYASDGYVLPAEDAQRLWAFLSAELPRRQATEHQSGSLTIVTRPLTLADRTPALLAMVAPSAGLGAAWRRLADAMLFAALLGLAVSLGLAWLLARYIAHPVTRLIAAADRIAQGLYDDPPMPAGQDEMGRLTLAFNAMRDQVRQTQKLQRDFLAGVTHDLKTPLSIIQGYASALSDGTADDETTRKRAEAGIMRETERMTRLIAALLELASLEAGLVPFEPVALDLAGLARQVLAGLAPQAQQKGLRLVDELPAALPLALADPTQMERVMVNLLENALRFTPAGGTITVGGATGQAGRLSLWMQDTGIGIPPQALPYVFDRFYQADPARPAGQRGSGLGLTIAREIVVRHGGDIKAESQPGQGTRFTLTFPVPAHLVG